MQETVFPRSTRSSPRECGGGGAATPFVDLLRPLVCTLPACALFYREFASDIDSPYQSYAGITRILVAYRMPR